MRKKIFKIIEIANDKDIISRAYDAIMLITIVVSMIPIAMKDNDGVYRAIDWFAAIVFTIDYILRIITADLKLKKGNKSFFIYPFTPMAVIDLLSILPVFTTVSSTFRVLKVFRLFRTLSVFRVFKVVRYSKSIIMISNVFKKQGESLLVVFGLALGYILVSALVMISVEPDSFATFFDAIYWATISLTTVGYGDVYAVSTVGRIITMLSSVLGIAIVALPAGIITAGYMEELHRFHDKEKADDELDLKSKGE